jgi:hypothetical protein
MEYNIVDSINLCSNQKKEIKRKTNKLNKQFSNLLKRKKSIKKKIKYQIEDFCKFINDLIKILNVKNFKPNVHQILPLFLCEKDNKEGILLNHYMGLGKTISGLLYSSYYNKKEIRKIILILPEFLISTWKSEIKIKGFDINIDEIIFIRYENFIDDIDILYKDYKKYSKKFFNNNHVLVIDESHKLTEEFNKLKNNKNKKLEKYYEMLKGINRKILLTGTPIFQSIYDLNYQINIVAGKDLLPLNELSFDREFKKNSLIKSGLYGWLVPLLKITLPLQMLYGITHTSLFISSVQPIAKISNLEQDSYSVASYYVPQNNNDNFIEKKIQINESQMNKLNNEERSLKYVNKYFSIFGMTLGLGALSTPIGNFILILPLVLLLITFVIGKLHDKYDLNKISHLNIAKISKLINPHCCYFKYKDLGVPIKNKKNICLSRKPPKSKDCDKLYLKLKNSNFPLFNFHIKKTYYTEYQTDLFIKLTLNRLNDNELKLLNLTKDYHPKFLEQKISNQDFRQIGLSIGNLFENSNDFNIFNEKIIILQNEIQDKIEKYHKENNKKNEKKIQKLLEESNFYNELTLENFLLNKKNKVNKNNKKFLDKIKIKEEYPEKFCEILKISINRRAVIYSNFYKNGLMYFTKFLDEMNSKKYKTKPISYYYIDSAIKEDPYLLENIINKFKNNEINFLLLCPEMVEGINIMKVQDFHLLEPLAEFNKIQQIFARVIRYNSHISLESQKRYVNIYMWNTYTKNFLSNFTTKFKYWKKFDTSKIYWERIHDFDQDISPDAITYKMLKKQEKHIYELEKVLKENNIFNKYKYLFT